MPSEAGARSFRDRRRPVISMDRQKPDLGARVAESAGQTAAGCAAVFCCCPCGLASLLYLAAVKFPAGLFRQTLGRGAKFAKKGAGIQPKKDVFDDDDAISVDAGWIPVALWPEDAWPSTMASPELVALEKEMSAWFYSAGFWRSPSQKE
ncbi:uncharacterized protein LOC122049266 [Zingiber officinale]|uniref:uncharacterized protein LOC122049266 n=1 Tax=Zingiber officinale TaxID=94328 RepID=UPI001C4C66D6|nr:uncharacterized protein LOC122049266 [Zingiber officinale]